MLDELDDERLRREPRLVWETFKRFVAMPVAADAPERLAERGGDVLLFEWGIAPSRSPETHVDVFFVSFVRQFTILDADDDYDRMEQLQCLLSISLSPELRELEAGATLGGKMIVNRGSPRPNRAPASLHCGTKRSAWTWTKARSDGRAMTASRPVVGM